MSIDMGAELTAQLLESRADAESLMLDTCTIIRLGEVVTDPDTGEILPPSETTIYTGRCKVKAPQRANQPTEVGAAVITVTPGAVHIPATGPDLMVGDVVEVTASELQSTLVGDRYKVTGPFDGTFITARRYPVESP